MARAEELFRVIEPTEPLEDPRSTSTLGGKPCMLGQTILPNDSFPGWELTPVLFDDTEQDGWIFALAPNTSTPVGFIERPQDLKKGDFPVIREYPVQGSGWALLQIADGRIFFKEFDSSKPHTLTYSEGTCIVYFAGPEGLVGVNTGKPPNIQEPLLEVGDTRACQDFWDLYKRLLKGSS